MTNRRCDRPCRAVDWNGDRRAQPDALNPRGHDDPRVGHALVSYLSAAAAGLSVTGPLDCGALRDPATIHATTVYTTSTAATSPPPSRSSKTSFEPTAPPWRASAPARGFDREALDHGATAAADKSDDVDQLAAVIQAATPPPTQQ